MRSQVCFRFPLTASASIYAASMLFMSAVQMVASACECAGLTCQILFEGTKLFAQQQTVLQTNAYAS